MPVLNCAVGSFSAVWSQPMSTEWVAIWCFVSFTLLLCAVCACEDFLSRVYPEHHRLQAPPKQLLQLATTSASQVPSDEDKTSGRTSDPEQDESSRTTRRQQDGVLASTCDAHCILVNGPHSARINKKFRKRQGVKLVTLISSYGLYSSGSLVKPSTSGGANSQLRTSHREPYSQDRDARRCHADDCFHIGVTLTPVDTSANRCQLQIAEALMAISPGRKTSVVRMHPLITDGGICSAPEVPRRPPLPTSRRPSQSSLDSGGLSAMPSARNSCAAIDRIHPDQAKGGVFLPARWSVEVSQDDPKMVPAVPPAIATSSENKPSCAVGLDRSL